LEQVPVGVDAKVPLVHRFKGGHLLDAIWV
jgi:hypothetical protein